MAKINRVKMGGMVVSDWPGRSSVPLYYQLKERIREQIEAGILKPGDKIPSERELSLAYGMSRMTVRQGLTELVNEGLLYREQGKGTFVSLPKISQGLMKLTSFTEDMLRRGLQPGGRVLSLEVVEATPRLAGILVLPEDRRIYRLERLRLADGHPMALEITHLPYHVFPDLMREELGHRSLYAILETKYGVKVQRAIQSLEPVVANHYEAEILGVAPGAPLLLMERTTYDVSDRPIEYVKSLYRGDRYKFVVELTR